MEQEVVASNLGVVYRAPGKVAVEALRDPARAQAASRGLTDLGNFLLIAAIRRIAGANDTCSAFAMRVAGRRFSHAWADQAARRLAQTSDERGMSSRHTQETHHRLAWLDRRR